MYERMLIKSCNDLGKAAYLKMLGWKCVGRHGKTFYFEVNEKINDIKKFDKDLFDWLDSTYNEFDSHLMRLKTLENHMPEDFNERFVD